MKGFVRTPDTVVDVMVEKLFAERPPTANSNVLDPGCGEGAFIGGIVRWCSRSGHPIPRIVGVEADPARVVHARDRFSGHPGVEVRHADFLTRSEERYDYIIGNPPYVPITELAEAERVALRSSYATAQRRFDLYLVFFEQALELLKPGGRLVFITPEKYLYVDSARPLRRLLSERHVRELHFLPEDTFSDLVTYPLVSWVDEASGSGTLLRGRHGNGRTIALSGRDRSWLPLILDEAEEASPLRLADVCTRISCGIATGADSVFVMGNEHIDAGLQRFARPTVAGRELSPGRSWGSRYSLLLPYSPAGTLLAEEELGAFGTYLRTPAHRERLLARTCVQRKPWYAFHETPPLSDLLRPKLLGKDITAKPFFVADRDGVVVPRHSVYYIVPRNAELLDGLQVYLNSAPAQEWLRNNCQRAANGFLRVQSRILQRLPLPGDFAADRTGAMDGRQARIA